MRAFPAWLHTVHHDGSDLHVSNLTPRLGETVTLRLRVGADAPVRKALLRTFPDGEQLLTAMSPEPNPAPPCAWWTVELPIHMPREHYRFLLMADDGAWWYNAAGVSESAPLDAFDFQILADASTPAWLPDAVFYQIFPDRFADGDPSNNPRPEEYEYRGSRPHTFPWGEPPDDRTHGGLVFYGGDLPGVAQHLDYLQDLGVNALYLTPIFTAYTNHKYDVADYDHVDPHFGGDAALAELRRALSARGMRYLLDIVPNHCGFMHPWFQRAQADAEAPEADFFTFHRRPDDYLSWLGVWALPKLNYQSAELRRRMYEGADSVFQRWLRPPYAADGWRVDVANMLARQGASQQGVEVAQGIRRAVKETNPEAYLMGENFFDGTPSLQGDQWDGVMNYMGFAMPLLYWLSGFKAWAANTRERVEAPRRWTTAALAETWTQRLAVIPWQVALQQYNLLGSHDTPRLRTALGGDEALQRLAVTLLLTYPGLPGLYYGDEIGMEDQPPILNQRGCMVWDESRWNRGLRRFYQDLIALRRGSEALQRGGFQILAVEEDALAYLRASRAGRVIVLAQRGGTPRPAGPLPVAQGGVPDGARFVEHFSGLERAARDGVLDLPAVEKGAQVWVEA